MKKILTIGGAVYDAFLQYEHVDTLQDNDVSYVIMRAGRKIEIDHIEYYSGGGAVNSAVSFSQLDHSVEAFFKTGMDSAGEFIVHDVQAHTITTPCVIKTADVSTGYSFIVPHPQGNRPILVYRGANTTLQEADIPYDSIKQADQLYITSLSGDAASVLLPIVMYAKKYNKNVAVNPGTSQLSAGAESLRVALPYIDILVLNRYESQLLMSWLNSSFSLNTFFEDIHQAGPSIVVVTDGAKGVHISDGTTIFFHPSIKTDVVSSVGAGDAFSSTFVSYYIRTHDIEYSLCAGMINSSSVIAHCGAQTGLLTYNELESALSIHDKNLVQKIKNCFI